MNHIGDIYFSSLFINVICKQNSNINFYYYFINGDIFFNHINNIKRIIPLEEKYNDNLINGDPPEDLLDKKLLRLLIDNNLQKKGFYVLNINNRNILFVNTWCMSDIISHNDYDIIGAINSYNKLIDIINNKFNLNIKFVYNNNVKFLDYINTDYKYIEVLDNINFENTVLIFNFKPRSTHINEDKLNNLIRDFSKDNNIILTSYNSLFDNIQNIKFIDKDFGIYPVPSCENLLQIWDIAVKCKKIIILQSGSSWTFLHKLHDLKNNQLFILDDLNYCNKLNNLNDLLLGTELNIVEVI